MYYKALLFVLLTVAAWKDIKSGRIPNIMLMIWLILGCILRFMEGGMQGVGMSIVRLLIPFALLYVLFALRMLGAGDIKACCVTAIYLNSCQEVLFFLFIAFLSGAVMALIKMLREKILIQRILKFLTYIRDSFTHNHLLIYESDAERRDMRSKLHFAIPMLISGVIQIGGLY